MQQEPPVTSNEATMDLKELETQLIQATMNQADAFEVAVRKVTEDRQTKNREVFGRLLNVAVNWHGVKVGDIAERCRSDPSTVSRWVNGKSIPSGLQTELVLCEVAKLVRERLAVTVANFKGER